MKNKMLTRATVLIATFLLAIPLIPVNAVSPAIVSFTPGTPNVDIGGTFAASMLVSNAPNLIAYDITLIYNPDVLTATSATLSGTLFDPAVHNVFVARAENFPSVGLVRYAVTFFSGETANPSSTGSSVLNLNFHVNDPATVPTATASDYPASIIVRSQIVILSNGDALTIPSINNDGLYVPPADTALRSVGCRAVTGGLNILAKGFNDGLFCRVTNTGAQSITAVGIFSWQSVGGQVGSTSSGLVTLSAGQAGQLDATLTVANANDIYIVTATVARAITFADGSVLTIPGPTSTFKVVVNTGL